MFPMAVGAGSFNALINSAISKAVTRDEVDGMLGFGAGLESATRVEAGLLGLVVPESYGGLGGNLRDLAAATFAMGIAFPSTALAYFFHCSTSSHGLPALGAIDEDKFTDEEIPAVRTFAENVLYHMGTKNQLLGNFVIETAKPRKIAPKVIDAVWVDMDRVAEETSRRWKKGGSAAEVVSAGRMRFA